jgi:hypothetical protein
MLVLCLPSTFHKASGAALQHGAGDFSVALCPSKSPNPFRRWRNDPSVAKGDCCISRASSNAPLHFHALLSSLQRWWRSLLQLFRRTPGWSQIRRLPQRKGPTQPRHLCRVAALPQAGWVALPL